MTDNGSAYTSKAFHYALAEAGVRHIALGPTRPARTKAER